MAGVSYRPGVLLVCSDGALTDRWSGWLEDAGFVTTSCVRRPGDRGCPRARGNRCPLHGAVDVVVAEDPRCVGPGHPPWAVLVASGPPSPSNPRQPQTVTHDESRAGLLAAAHASLGSTGAPVLAWRGRYRARPTNPRGPGADPEAMAGW